MDDSHKLALIVAFYLSKYDLDACHRLGFRNRTHAFSEVGKHLEVKSSTVKNMRDDFDSIYPHRMGWHQRELRPSRLEVVAKYQDMSEEALFEIVRDILDAQCATGDSLHTRVVIVGSLGEESDNRDKRQFGNRALTGIRAEEVFKAAFERGEIQGFDGVLVDKRQDGCGYDFEMVGEPKYAFEVKGLGNGVGGVLFTDKEWSVAKDLKINYILALVSNVSSGEPSVTLIRDPYTVFRAQKRLQRSVSVSWVVDGGQLQAQREEH